MLCGWMTRTRHIRRRRRLARCSADPVADRALDTRPDHQRRVRHTGSSLLATWRRVLRCGLGLSGVCRGPVRAPCSHGSCTLRGGGIHRSELLAGQRTGRAAGACQAGEGSELVRLLRCGCGILGQHDAGAKASAGRPAPDAVAHARRGHHAVTLPVVWVAERVEVAVRVRLHRRRVGRRLGRAREAILWRLVQVRPGRLDRRGVVIIRTEVGQLELLKRVPLHDPHKHHVTILERRAVVVVLQHEPDIGVARNRCILRSPRLHLHKLEHLEAPALDRHLLDLLTVRQCLCMLAALLPREDAQDGQLEHRHLRRGRRRREWRHKLGQGSQRAQNNHRHRLARSLCLPCLRHAGIASVHLAELLQLWCRPLEHCAPVRAISVYGTPGARGTSTSDPCARTYRHRRSPHLHDAPGSRRDEPVQAAGVRSAVMHPAPPVPAVPL